MRKAILVLALLLVAPSAFGQNSNNEASGGKTNEGKTAPAKNASASVRKKPVPKPAPKQDKPVVSPCAGYNKTGSESNASDKWFSLGESANKHFWYNPHKTTCDAKTGVLKTEYFEKGELVREVKNGNASVQEKPDSQLPGQWEGG